MIPEEKLELMNEGMFVKPKEDNNYKIELVPSYYDYNEYGYVRYKEISMYEIEKMIENGVEFDYCDEDTKNFIYKKLDEIRQQRQTRRIK